MFWTFLAEATQQDSTVPIVVGAGAATANFSWMVVDKVLAWHKARRAEDKQEKKKNHIDSSFKSIESLIKDFQSESEKESVSFKDFVRSRFDDLKLSIDREANSIRDYIKELTQLTEDLHEWHDNKDEDNVFVWYVRKSLRDSINNLHKSLEKQIDVLDKLAEIIEENHNRADNNGANRR